MNRMSSPLVPVTPKREWLIRCENTKGVLSVCSIEASGAQIHLCDSEGEVTILDGPQILEYRAALDAAIAQVEDDLRTRQARRDETPVT